MIGYNTLQKSMNGVKVLTDGISFISDGNAEHQNIVYSEYIKSDSGLTTLADDSLQTDTISCTDINCQTFDASAIQTVTITSEYLKILNHLTSAILLEVDGITQNKIIANVQTTMNNLLLLVNADIQQTQTGRIYQQGTNSNYLKDTYINGYLQVGSNITQSGGSASLTDVTIDTLTMRTDKGIQQSGTNVTNSFGGTTTVKSLIVTDSVVLPANIEVPDFTTNDDIIMQTDAVIIQDITTVTTNKNILRATKTLNLEVDGDITQIKAGATATLKNTIVQGTAQIQGDITQTAGSCTFKTISCNNITLNADQLLTQSGTGYITQSGTGQNVLKEINLLSNANIIFNGTGIISQALSGINILSHFRSAGYGIIGGRNNTTFTNTQNIQNNNGLQIQFNRDNSTQYSFLMSNRSAGGNGGFRIQRYIAGVYLDEPMVIDDNITMNKNLSIPGGSISCSSATIGNISQSELNCLDNCAQNINDKFTSLDSQITALQTSSTNNNTALTGFTYTSATDTTLIDNNLTISSGKNLLVGSTNILSSINAINFTLSGFIYDFSQDLNYIDNNVTIASGKNLLIGSTNILSSINTLNNITSGVTYNSTSDTTNCDNNLQITSGKKLYIGSMDVEAEINALDTSFTTGTINTTDLTTNNLYVNNNVLLNQNSGTTYLYSDMRLINTVNKNNNEFFQMYCANSNIDNILYRPNGNYNLFIRNATNNANTQILQANLTNFNIKNTNALIDNNLTVNGTTTLQTVNVNNDLTVNDTFTVTNTLQTYPNYVFATDFTEKVTTTQIGTTATIDLASLTLTEPFSKEIYLNLSISGGLQYQNPSLNILNRIQYTVKYNNFNVSIYKNNVLWQSNVTLYNPFGMFQENTFRMVYSQFPAYIKYFMNNTQFRFSPDIQNTATTDIYTIRITFTLVYSLLNYNVSTGQLSTFTGTFTQFTPSIYSNVNYSYNGTNSSLTQSSSSIDIISYTPQIYSSTNFTINNDVYRFGLPTSTIKETQIVNAYSNNLRSNNLNSTNSTFTNSAISNINIASGVVTNNLRCKTFIAGYLVNGNTPYDMKPIICSLNGISPNNDDDYYIIMPGFKFELYDSQYYFNLKQTVENNSSDDSPQIYAVNSPNTTSSIKVFFRPTNTSSYTEIKLSPISLDVNGN